MKCQDCGLELAETPRQREFSQRCKEPLCIDRYVMVPFLAFLERDTRGKEREFQRGTARCP